MPVLGIITLGVVTHGSSEQCGATWSERASFLSELGSFRMIRTILPTLGLS